MKITNDNTKRPWRGRGGGRGNTRKSPGRGRGQQGQGQDASKKEKKIHQSVPFTSHNASTHHTYSDTKEHFVRAASIKLGEYANDVRNALDTEIPYTGTKPTRQQAANLKTTMPNSKISQREDEVNMTAEQRLEQRETEANLYGRFVTEHHWNQSARLLDDVSASTARLIMTAQEHSGVLAAFIQNLEAHIMAAMQTALPLEHEEYGHGSKKHKSDKS